MTWQPIATAPKGPELLLFQSGCVTVGHWDEDEYAKKPRPFWHTDRTIIFGRGDSRKNPPSHWMPLPEAP